MSAGLACAGLVLAPTIARAETEYSECTGEPSADEVEAAQGAFKAGKAAFDEADYERAINYWLDAYRRDCRAHDLLQNLSRAYELSGNRPEAIHALETYLLRKPDTPQREQFERRIEKLKEQAAAKATEPAPGTQPEESSTEPPPPLPPPPPPPAAETHKPVSPLVLGGAGLALAAGGGVWWFVTRDKVSQFEDQCGTSRKSCPAGVKEDANAARTRLGISGAMAIGGLAVAATGVVWYVVAPAKPRTTGPSTTVAPLVGTGFVGAMVSGRF